MHQHAGPSHHEVIISAGIKKNIIILENHVHHSSCPKSVLLMEYESRVNIRNSRCGHFWNNRSPFNILRETMGSFIINFSLYRDFIVFSPRVSFRHSVSQSEIIQIKYTYRTRAPPEC